MTEDSQEVCNLLMKNNTRSKILIVDDIIPNIKLLEKSLKPDYDVLTTLEGESALKIAREQQPDLILLDIVMPGMNGYEVCREMKAREETKKIPIIFITSLSEDEDETTGLELGAVDYIVKPFRMPIIRARLKNHLKLKHYRDLLEKVCLTDALTQIANRRNFSESFHREWRRAQRNGCMLSLIVVDIDYFKKYNDAYGHDEGDRCLRKVAKTLEATMRRPLDLAARLGGEEFACVLPETDEIGARHIAEMIRQNVQHLEIAHRGSPVAEHVTISVGFSCMVPKPGMEAEALYQSADEALYTAKQGGRNRVSQGK